MKVKSEILRRLYEGAATAGGWKFVTTVVRAQGRWSSNEWMIIEPVLTPVAFETVRYGIEYTGGLTEDQDSELPWDPPYADPPEELAVFKVRAKAKTIVVYERVT